jgi:predicted RNA binding protein YcfA (HicA-like mRNA interferase family)
MPRKHREVVGGLKAKGFDEVRQGKHIHFVYIDKNGQTTTSRTMVSHDAGGNDICDGLLRRMAGQVGLKPKDFLDLVDCPMSRDEFDKKGGR